MAAGYAAANAALAGRSADVEIRRTLIDEALHPGETFPIILADPPYLPSRDTARWPGDPVRAIDGGPDGMDVVRTCLAVAADHLLVGGPLLLQVAGDAQARAVEAIVDADARLAFRQVRRHDAERAVVLMTRLA